MTRRLPPLLTLLTVIAAAAALIGLDLMRPSQATSQPDPAVAGAAVAGSWYCAAGATGEGHELRATASSPPGADVPAEVEFTLQHDDVTERLGIERVFPGTGHALAVPGDLQELAVAARWWDWPAVVARTWSVQGAGLPTGLVSGPCAPGPSETWYVPGMSTAGGASARLYLANPFETDASVVVRFTSPEGEIAPLLLENVVVPAHGVTVLDLNEHAPRESDIGVIVESRSGRVVAEGVQIVSAAIGGIDGVALVRATPRLATTWTVPWSVSDPLPGAAEEVPVPEDGGGAGDAETSDGQDTADVGAAAQDAVQPVDATTSWLWVSNPGTDAAAVTVTLHGEEGAVVPDIGDELTVDPGATLRIDLRGLLPGTQRLAGATVRSENSVPVAVSVGSLLAHDNPARTGFAAQIGVAGPDSTWVLPGEQTGGRRQVLHLVNPTAEAAVVEVTLWNGSAVVEPESLREVTVPAGALVGVELTEFLPEASHHTVFVRATQGEVVAGRESIALRGPAAWVVQTGVPGRLWEGGEAIPPVTRRDGLLTRLDTLDEAVPAGPDAEDLDDLEEPAESATPTG